ncbi:hypothetical protein CRG98_034016 [Punica granatum]|uniref:Uncharacterized protein n=1 Tax=Punica granatum TaxID=22663 RepID=A0A2I0IPW0_PUNGR|nr:hypothetical protein CRG98_034016 [Punica granatum]
MRVLDCRLMGLGHSPPQQLYEHSICGPSMSLRRSTWTEGLGWPINDPSIEVASVLRGYRRPRWRGKGRRLAAPAPNHRGFRVRMPDRFANWDGQSTSLTPPSRSPASSVGTNDLCARAEVIDWQTQSTNPLLRLGVPNQCGGWGRQLATPTPPPRSPVSTEDGDDLGAFQFSF